MELRTLCHLQLSGEGGVLSHHDVHVLHGLARSGHKAKDISYSLVVVCVSDDTREAPAAIGLNEGESDWANPSSFSFAIV